MNELTYQLLADVADGLGTDLSEWHTTVAHRTGEDDATTRSRVLGWIRASVEQDIMGLGSLEPDEEGQGRWSNWDGRVADRLERAGARYGATGTLWNVFATDTPRGMDLYEAEVVPGFAAHSMGEEAAAYVTTTMERFDNPFLDHRIKDIASGHRQKMQRRIGGFMEWVKVNGGPDMPKLDALLVQYSGDVAA